MQTIITLEAALGREINPTIFTTDDFLRKLNDKDGFLPRVMEQPKLWIIGSEHAVAA